MRITERPPRHDPLRYPGTFPATSYLLLAGEYVRVDPRPRRRVGEALVHGDRGLEPLSDALERLGGTAMAQRWPYLAIGSNGAPAQLDLKLREGGVSPVVPVMRATVHDASVVFATRLAPYGSVPAAIARDVGAATELFVTFLDDAQRVVVDRTEAGGYDLRELDADDHAVVLESGEVLARCVAYVSPSLLLFDGALVRLAELGSSGSTLAGLAQPEALRRVGDMCRALLPDVPSEPGAIVRAIAGDRALHRRMVEHLEARHGSTDAVVRGRAPEQPRYG